MASALVLSAASPFWASLLNKQGENDVVLPDEKTATVRTYLEAIFACNSLYQNARIRKYFNVSRKGKLSELRSFVYPQVSVEILDSEKKLQRYVGKKPNISVISPVKLVPSLKRLVTPIKPRIISSHSDIDKRKRSNSEVKKSFVTVTPIKRPRLFKENLKLTDLTGLEKPSVVKPKSVEPFEYERTVFSDKSPRHESKNVFHRDPTVKLGGRTSVVAETRKNTNPLTTLENSLNGIITQSDEICDEPDNDGEYYEPQHSDHGPSSPETNKLEFLKQASTNPASDSKVTVKGKIDLRQRLAEMRDEGGSIYVIASDGKSEARIVLGSNDLSAIHHCMHYFMLVSLDHIDVLKIIQSINSEERDASDQAVEPIFTLFKNAVELLKDVNELNEVESLVYNKIETDIDKIEHVYTNIGTKQVGSLVTTVFLIGF